MKQIFAIAGLALVFASCGSKFEKAPSGLTYKIIKGDGKEKLKAGQIIKINGIVRLTPKDSVMFTTYGHLPEYLPVDTSAKNSYDFNEILPLASVGDSIVTVAQVDSLVKKGFAQYSELLKKGDQIQTSLKILQVFNNEQDKAADQQKELDLQKQREIAQLESYLKKKGIKAEKTENGVFVAVTNPGQGVKGAPGQQVTVNYTGSLLENDKKFDSNVDTSFGHVQPFSFVIGSGQTIRAWEEGFQYFGKGGKGTIYVPSLMGYGPPGKPPVIPAYAPLIFEVEVTDVVPAPAQPQMSMMDPRLMDPRQQGGDPRQQAPPQQAPGNN